MRIAVWLPVLASIPGCSTPSSGASGVTYAQAGSTFYPAWCGAMQRCGPNGFAVTFAGGVSQCAAWLASGLPIGGDGGTSTGCTQEQVDRCVSDFATFPCGDLYDSACDTDGGVCLPKAWPASCDCL